MNIKLYKGDCLEILPTIEDKSVDAVICDLPYGCLNRSNKHAAWDRELPLEALWEQWKRIVKPNGVCCLVRAGDVFCKTDDVTAEDVSLLTCMGQSAQKRIPKR